MGLLRRSAPRPSSDPRRPYPAVALGGDYLRRVEQLTLRLAATKERREGAGSAAVVGAGEEFVGYRPYRDGEDLRGLAWDLLARLDRPYVRVTRREAAERWSVLLDTSASMAVGPPGKLQVAAEVVGALASLALRGGAAVEVAASDGSRPLTVRRPADLARTMDYLEGRQAEGDGGLAQLLATTRPPADCGRVVVVGDLCDLSPADLAPQRAPGRELLCLQVLAPLELVPPEGTAVRWLDPEGGGERSLDLDRATLVAYERALEGRLAAWDRAAARHGFRHRVHATDHPFEDAVRRLLEG